MMIFSKAIVNSCFKQSTFSASVLDPYTDLFVLSIEILNVISRKTFSLVLQSYSLTVGSETGFEIDIRDNRVQIRCPPTLDTVSKDPPSSLLSNRTNNFMKKFAFRSISLQQPTEQLAILRAHSSSVAFCSNGRNTYLLAARHPNMRDLMQKLLALKQVDNKPIKHPLAATSATQGPTKSYDQK